MVEILHDLVNKTPRSHGSGVYMGSCRIWIFDSRMICDGCPSLGFWIAGWPYSNFLASTAPSSLHIQNKGPIEQTHPTV